MTDDIFTNISTILYILEIFYGILFDNIFYKRIKRAKKKKFFFKEQTT